MTDSPDLPLLHQADLDAALLEAYFEDLRGHAEIIGVTVKAASEEYAGARDVGLDQGQALITSGAVRGLQIRYVFDGQEWWDTLIRLPSAVRLVRIQQNFG